MHFSTLKIHCLLDQRASEAMGYAIMKICEKKTCSSLHLKCHIINSGWREGVGNED